MAKDRGLRRHERRAFGYAAAVDFQDGKPPRRCIVIDISEGGARLQLMRSERVPDTVKVMFSSGGRVARLARVRWRSLPEFGVQFVKR